VAVVLVVDAVARHLPRFFQTLFLRFGSLTSIPSSITATTVPTTPGAVFQASGASTSASAVPGCPLIDWTLLSRPHILVKFWWLRVTEG